MPARLAWLLAACPLAGAAQQQPVLTHPPVHYAVGLSRAPLFHALADTLGKPARYLPSQADASVVGRVSSRWVVVRLEGFSYFTRAALLTNYDPADADPLPLDNATQRITYTGVVQVPGAAAADLYARARAWVAATYTQQNAQLTREDPAAGQLQLQGARLVQLPAVYKGVPRGTYGGVVRHSLSIYVKDGRFKYVLTDLVHDAQQAPYVRSGGPLEQDKANLFGYIGLGSQKPWSDLKTQALRDARQLVASLQAAMTLQKSSVSKAADDF